MDNKTENLFNTLAYILIIIAEIIFIYVTNNNNLNEKEKDELVSIARNILLITAIYFFINSLMGLNKNRNISQYKQVLAAILVLIASSIRTNIKSSDITFR